MYDSILYYSKIAEKKSTILKDLNLVNPQLLRLRNPKYYLATLHRAENTDDPKRLKSILKALNEIGKKYSCHPSPSSKDKEDDEGLSSLLRIQKY